MWALGTSVPEACFSSPGTTERPLLLKWLGLRFPPLSGWIPGHQNVTLQSLGDLDVVSLLPAQTPPFRAPENKKSAENRGEAWNRLLPPRHPLLHTLYRGTVGGTCQGHAAVGQPGPLPAVPLRFHKRGPGAHSFWRALCCWEEPGLPRAAARSAVLVGLMFPE